MIWRTPPHIDHDHVVVEATPDYVVIAAPNPAEPGSIYIELARIQRQVGDFIFTKPYIDVMACLSPDGLWLWSSSVPDECWHAVHKAAWMAYHVYWEEVTS